MSAVFHHIGGSGPEVLLIHGFGADRLGWAFTSSVLTPDFSVWAVDLPGHGAADSDVGDGSLRALCDGVVEALPFDGPFRTVGHSMGGAIALELARRRLVSRAVLLAPAGMGQHVTTRFVQGLPEVREAEGALELLRYLVANPRLIAPQMVDHLLNSLKIPGRREALRLIASHLLDGVNTELPKDVPITIIWGEKDRVNAPPQPPPVEDFHLLKNVGHLPHAEAAMAVNKIIKQTLSA